MAMKMTANGVSTTTAPGTEQYETFYSAHSGKHISRVMYDYRHTDGELFSCVAPTLKECRQRRDEWLKKK
ncbi:MAG: DUF3873 domain-containing protein [Lachnospiraceae bacterium]|nr:DUF3873 domain-containing protein [Lachnospiraceae bacterium]